MLTLIPAALLLQGSLQDDLSALLQNPALERATVGVMVQEFGGGTVFSLNADKRLMPASALKLVTAAFAMDALGSGYQFGTRAWRSHGGLRLKGGADPLLSLADLLVLGDSLDAKPGEVVNFDDSILGPDRVNGAWEYGDMMRSDAPPVSGLTVNGGYADLVVTGGVPMLKPRNFGMTVKRGRAAGEPSVRRPFGSWSVLVSGKLPTADPSFASVSLPDPGLCAAMALTGKARRASLGEPPPDAVTKARPFVEVLSAMLKKSDNHAAETVLRLAGKAKGGDGSWDDALARERDFLARIGVSAAAFRLADGCGLARFNEISPRALIQCLEWSLRSPASAMFADSMCAPGEGTLRSRLAGVSVRAKTGTLTGVCSLVGFVDTAGGKRLLFAIVFNHYDGPASSVRPIQDAIVRRLATETRPATASPR